MIKRLLLTITFSITMTLSPIQRVEASATVQIIEAVAKLFSAIAYTMEDNEKENKPKEKEKKKQKNKATKHASKE